MPYNKQQWNQYDDNKSVEANIANDAVITPSKMNKIEDGITLVEKESSEKIKEKLGGDKKVEPENLSARTLGLVTGTGGPINLESIPQDYSVTVKKTNFLEPGGFSKVTTNLYTNVTLSPQGDFYMVENGKMANTTATQPYKNTGKIPLLTDADYKTKGVNMWLFYGKDDTYLGYWQYTESGAIDAASLQDLPIRANASYMIGNINNLYWKVSPVTTPEILQITDIADAISFPKLVVESGNLGDEVKEMIGGAGIAKQYRNETIVNFGDSIIENKNPSVSDFLAEYTGATTINVGFGGCMMSPHPNADFAKFSMSNLVDAIVSKNFSAQEASLSASGIPSGFRATLTALKAIDFLTVKTISISYGTNDWLNSNKIDNPLDKYDKAYYLGALRYSVRKMQQNYPNLEVVVSPPIFRSTNDRTENANNWKNGNKEYLKDYANAVTNVAKELKILASDTFYGLGINEFNEGHFFPTTDGTHPNAKGRALLASKLAETIVYGASASPNELDLDTTEFERITQDLKDFQEDLVNGSFDSSVLETNIAEKLTNLEAEYAPELTEVTAQLAQTVNPNNAVQKNTNGVMPMVTFIDDDGRLPTFNKLKPLFDSKGAKFSFAVSSQLLYDKGRSDYMSLAQVQQMIDEGFELVGHGQNHIAMTTNPQEIEGSLLDFKNYGYNVKHNIYPGGTYNQSTINENKKHFQTGVSVDRGINTIPIRTHALKRYAVGSHTSDNVPFEKGGTLAGYKKMVDEALEKNGWLILMMHSWNPDHDEQQQQNIGGMIDYIQSLNIPIVSMDKAMEVYSNRIDVGDEKIGHFLVGADGTTKGTSINKLAYKYIGHNPSITIDTPGSYFEKGFLNAATFDLGSNTGFPTSSGGLLETTFLEEYTIHQKWLPFNSSEEWTRYYIWNQNSWSSFSRKTHALKTVSATIASQIVNANSVKEVRISGLNLSTYVPQKDTIIVQPNGGLENNLMHSVSAWSDKTIVIRLFNPTSSAITTSERNWNIKVIKE